MILSFMLALLGGETTASFAVYPSEVRLDSALDSQRIVVVASDYDDTDLDLTESAYVTVTDETVATYDGGVLSPVSDGETSLRISARGETLTVPIVVSGATTTPEISFNLDVIPIFTAAGCNAGGCHGQASGKDGFHLSLFGYDPEGDHRSLIEQLPGRRLNLAFPGSSLLLEKAAGAVPHTGGRLIEPDGSAYRQIERWIEAGGPKDHDEVASVTHIELSPPALLLRGPSKEVPLVIRAHYSDGTDHPDHPAPLRSQLIAAALRSQRTARSSSSSVGWIGRSGTTTASCSTPRHFFCSELCTGLSNTGRSCYYCTRKQALESGPLGSLVPRRT